MPKRRRFLKKQGAKSSESSDVEKSAAAQDEIPSDEEKRPLNEAKSPEKQAQTNSHHHSNFMKRFSKSSSDVSNKSNTPTPPGSPALVNGAGHAPEASGEFDSEISEPKIKKKITVLTHLKKFAPRRNLKKDDSQQSNNSQTGSPSSSPKTAAKKKEKSAETGKSTEDDLCDSGIAIDSDKSAAPVISDFPFFQLDVQLRNGKGLIAMDASGTSDPYVKIKSGGKLLYKSKTINKTLDPWWDEIFSLPIEDINEPLLLKVYDYDFGRSDDFMGATTILLKNLELNKNTNMTLFLEDTGKKITSAKKSDLGELNLTLTLLPKTQVEKDDYFNKSGKQDLRKMKNITWNSVVTIVLVEGKDLLPMDENGFSDPYVKFRLGNEKYKSKNASKTLTPSYNEQFELHMFPDQPKMLEVTVWDRDIHTKDDIMGRCVIDLNKLETEVTHRLWQDLEDGAGCLYMLITISGTSSDDSVSALEKFNIDDTARLNIAQQYSLLRSFKELRNIGWILVKVYKAQGLASADIGGKSDPFCTLELVNSRVQTQTEYKTLTPTWDKFYTFKVLDIHSMLEVTVYDEDRDHRVEFLGKIGVPLLKIKNGEKRWFALKDKKLKSRAKGQILIEMEVIYNPVRASIRTFNPKEKKYIQEPTKFKRALFMRNVNRIKLMAMDFVEGAKFLNSCFQWESAPRSATAFAVFLLIVYFFELYMVPFVLLIVFLKNYIVLTVVGWSAFLKDDDEDYADEDDDDDDEKEKKLKSEDMLDMFSDLHDIIKYDCSIKTLLAGLETICNRQRNAKEEKKSLKDKLMAVQEVTAMVQNILGDIASMGESVKNTFNFTVPFLSWLLIIVLTIGVFVLYHVPLRYIIMAWGINKFTKKLRAPNAIPNNELIDFLSRVPDDEMKIMTRDLRPNIVPGTEAGKIRRKKTN